MRVELGENEISGKTSYDFGRQWAHGIWISIH